MNWDGIHAALEAERLNAALDKAPWYKVIGISETLYSDMANGKPVVRAAKRRGIEQGAGWPKGMIERMLAGEPAPPLKTRIDRTVERLLMQINERIDFEAEERKRDVDKAHDFLLDRINLLEADVRGLAEQVLRLEGHAGQVGGAQPPIANPDDPGEGSVPR